VTIVSPPVPFTGFVGSDARVEHGDIAVDLDQPEPVVTKPPPAARDPHCVVDAAEGQPCLRMLACESRLRVRWLSIERPTARQAQASPQLRPRGTPVTPCFTGGIPWWPLKGELSLGLIEPSQPRQ
jgi:hypothetical protein